MRALTPFNFLWISLLFLFPNALTRAESRFLFESQAQRDLVTVTLVHSADENATPTAAHVSGIVMTNVPAAVMTSTRDRAASRRHAAPVSRPRQGAPGHVLSFKAAVQDFVPGAELTSGTIVLQFRLPVRALPCAVEVYADRDRGGLRAWDGRDVTPEGALARMTLEIEEADPPMKRHAPQSLP